MSPPAPCRAPASGASNERFFELKSRKNNMPNEHSITMARSGSLAQLAGFDDGGWFDKVWMDFSTLDGATW
jgi:hypothetical protein